MNPLIPTREHVIGGVLQPSVDARDLWVFFKPYSTFANWIANKLLQHHQFAEHSHYVRVKILREITYGGHTRVSHQVDFMLSVPMAESIANAEFCRGPVPWH